MWRVTIYDFKIHQLVYAYPEKYNDGLGAFQQCSDLMDEVKESNSKILPNGMTFNPDNMKIAMMQDDVIDSIYKKGDLRAC